MPGNYSGIWRGASSFPSPPNIMGLDEDGFEGRGVLRVGFPGVQGGDARGPAVPHHLQLGGGCGGETLV